MSEAKTRKPATKNQLVMKEILTLCNWVKTNEEALVGKPRTEIARIAEQELGFRITEHNITGACEASGVRLTPKPPASPHASREQALVLADELSAVLKALGMPVSERLQAVISELS